LLIPTAPVLEFVLFIYFQVVVGYLQTNRSTGRLQLIDQTGSIDCIAGVWPPAAGEALATAEHCCWSADCVSSAPAGQSCPYVQSSLLGGIFRVDRFRLVVETFYVADVVCPYVQFSATDLLRLSGQQPTPKSFPLSASKSNRLPDSEAAKVRHIAVDGGSPVWTVSKPTKRQNDSSDDLFASFADSPSFRRPLSADEAAADRCRCSVSQLFVLDCCENLMLDSYYVEPPSLCFTAIGRLVGPPRLSDCRSCWRKSPGNSAAAPARLPTARPVALLFRRRAVRWYPVLQAGCVYRLVRRSADVVPFLGKFALPRTRWTKLERHAGQCLLVLESGVHVERIAVSSSGYNDLLLSTEEHSAISAAVNDVSERLKRSDEIWLPGGQATIAGC